MAVAELLNVCQCAGLGLYLQPENCECYVFYLRQGWSPRIWRHGWPRQPHPLLTIPKDHILTLDGWSPVTWCFQELLLPFVEKSLKKVIKKRGNVILKLLCRGSRSFTTLFGRGLLIQEYWKFDTLLWCHKTDTIKICSCNHVFMFYLQYIH